MSCDNGYCACNGGPSMTLEPRDNPYTLRGEHGRDGWNWLSCYCGRRWPCKKVKYDEEKNMAKKLNVYDDTEQTVTFKYGDREYTVKGYVIAVEISGGRATLDFGGKVTSRQLPHPDCKADHA